CLVGAAALPRVRPLASGYCSKEEVLAGAWAAERGALWLGLAGLVAAFATAVYIFRAVFIVFFGAPAPADAHGDESETPVSGAAARRPAERTSAAVTRGAGRRDAAPPGAPRDVRRDPTRAADGRRTRLTIAIPLVALSVLSIVGGFVETPASLGDVSVFSRFMASALPETAGAEDGAGGIALELAAAVISLAGIALAYWLFFPGRGRHAHAAEPWERPPWPLALDRLWASGWGFDRLYDAALVRPFMLA